MLKIINDYSSYLKDKFGTKVNRIAIDAGFSCPNRDGKVGVDGCSFCNAAGSRAAYVKDGLDIHSQIEDRISYLKAMKGTKKFIAYFQPFTNTYASAPKLKEIYDNVLPFRDIVGISIGTRPDCIDDERAKLIASYMDKFEVWVELGLQSSHDKTLNAINRGHDYKSFVDAVTTLKKHKISISAHVIIGLPGEEREDIIETAKRLTQLKVHGVKIHLLHILRGSRLQKDFEAGKVKLLQQDEYVSLAADFLENTSQDVVIQRLTGEGDRENHIAPEWAFDKLGTINKIVWELERRKSYQGKKV